MQGPPRRIIFECCVMKPDGTDTEDFLLRLSSYSRSLILDVFWILDCLDVLL